MIRDLLKKYKFKVDEDESEGEHFTFYNKDFTMYAMVEGTDDIQYGITGIHLDEEEELSSYFFDRFIEYGNLEDFDDYLASVTNGEFRYLLNMYKSVKKLKVTYEEQEEDLEYMLREITN